MEAEEAGVIGAAAGGANGGWLATQAPLTLWMVGGTAAAGVVAGLIAYYLIGRAPVNA